MRVFIQRCADGFFWKADGVWTALKEDATDFRNCNPAIDFTVEHGLRDVRLWVSFDDPKYDFPVEGYSGARRIIVRQKRDENTCGND